MGTEGKQRKHNFVLVCKQFCRPMPTTYVVLILPVVALSETWQS